MCCVVWSVLKSCQAANEPPGSIARLVGITQELSAKGCRRVRRAAEEDNGQQCMPDLVCVM
jgi:hypothetical protein